MIPSFEYIIKHFQIMSIGFVIKITNSFIDNIKIVIYTLNRVEIHEED